MYRSEMECDADCTRGIVHLMGCHKIRDDLDYPHILKTDPITVLVALVVASCKGVLDMKDCR